MNSVMDKTQLAETRYRDKVKRSKKKEIKLNSKKQNKKYRKSIKL